MAVALGGRIAEELIFGEDDITTGAGGDFQQVRTWFRLVCCACVCAWLADGPLSGVGLVCSMVCECRQ